ncbi:hypothetical protein CHLNCDRAFT_138631 [Chlorella variabilis]|uniref:MYND-type domain-containing protein n=1 Tax=Chlorella variabilis TaxID=554065 RepID=E1ZNF5_CHLVA|nr:hypothetical protein CHLNCDRAFT_138631 [Chlorella variabilis]EFN52671.1 hypothetical protein CHLNCDRAFT_138631 [Chlorella variabilis]|eukprot:XP_005844773.1 hypothetical protein CHLNCDRAFT_138631 [Chlorella variabilis]
MLVTQLVAMDMLLTNADQQIASSSGRFGAQFAPPELYADWLEVAVGAAKTLHQSLQHGGGRVLLRLPSDRRPAAYGALCHWRSIGAMANILSAAEMADALAAHMQPAPADSSRMLSTSGQRLLQTACLLMLQLVAADEEQRFGGGKAVAQQRDDADLQGVLLGLAGELFDFTDAFGAAPSHFGEPSLSSGALQLTDIVVGEAEVALHLAAMAAAHMQMLQAVICDAGRTDELLASAAQQLSIHSATVASSIGACAILCPAAFSPPLRELLSEMVAAASPRLASCFIADTVMEEVLEQLIPATLGGLDMLAVQGFQGVEVLNLLLSAFSALCSAAEGMVASVDSGSASRAAALQPELAATLLEHWARPEQQQQDALQLAQAAAARSCAYLRCSNVGGEGGPAAGQGGGSQRCGACRAVWYCSTACSHADWRQGGHRRVCKALGAARQQQKQQAAAAQRSAG